MLQIRHVRQVRPRVLDRCDAFAGAAGRTRRALLLAAGLAPNFLFRRLLRGDGLLRDFGRRRSDTNDTCAGREHIVGISCPSLSR